MSFLRESSFVFAAFVKKTDGYYSFTKTGKILMWIVAAAIVIGVIALKISLAKKNEGKSSKPKLTVKQITFCAICMALSIVLSNVKFLSLYNGGSITLFSMFFITYIAYSVGLSTGLACGFAYGIFNFLQDPYLLSVTQVLFDYVFAFTALGLGAIFRNLKSENKEKGEKKLTKASLIACFLTGAVMRGVFASVAGYLFWMDYMPESFPKKIAILYPVAYNFCYIGVEAALTVVVLLVPGVSSVLMKIRREVEEK